MYAMIFECVLQYRVARSYAYVCVCWSQHTLSYYYILYVILIPKLIWHPLFLVENEVMYVRLSTLLFRRAGTFAVACMRPLYGIIAA